MNYTKSFLIRSVVAVAALGSFTACEDLSLCGLTEEDLSMGDAFVETTSYFMNIVGRTDEAMRNEDLQVNGSTTIDGATVTRTNDSITIDFGSNNVVTADGKTRRGVIKGFISGDYFQENGSINLSLENYHVNDSLIAGDISLVNNGNNSGQGPWDINLSSTNFAIGNQYDYSANLTMQWDAGYETIDSTADDRFKIFGTADGNDNIQGISFATSFPSAMVFDRSCAYVVTEGSVDVSLTSGESEVASVNVDFLDSDGCNNVLMLNASCDGTDISFPQNFDGF
ncbi:MAG: hypothetical protein HWE14_11750 [Flavobacteriia bacterium]|nr:hypothetical protein [Flavobacteriia bacterium]